jgi:hypothetical protein
LLESLLNDIILLMSNGPVSQRIANLGELTPSQYVVNAPLTEEQQAFGFRIGYLRDQADEHLPSKGDTAYIGITKRGMTPPILFMTAPFTARLKVAVLAGQGLAARAFSTGGTELLKLEEGVEMSIGLGQALACINTDRKHLLLRAISTPAFLPEHLVQLVRPFAKTEPIVPTTTSRIFQEGEGEGGKVMHIIPIERSVAPVERFYRLIDQATNGKVKAWQ